MSDKTFMLFLKWKTQTVEECAEWARINVNDEKRIEDYKAGVAAGWAECIKTLNMHKMIKEG